MRNGAGGPMALAALLEQRRQAGVTAFCGRGARGTRQGPSEFARPLKPKEVRTLLARSKQRVGLLGVLRGLKGISEELGFEWGKLVREV